MDSAARVRSGSLDGSLDKAMRRNNAGENSAGNNHENDAGDGDEVPGDRGSTNLVHDHRFRLQAEQSRLGNRTLAMEDTFQDTRMKQEEGDTGQIRGGGGSVSSSGSEESNANDTSKNSTAGVHRMSSSGMASLDEMDANTLGEIPDLSENNNNNNNDDNNNNTNNIISTNFSNEHGGRNTDINDNNNDNNNDEMMDEEDEGEEDEEDGDEDEGDEEDEEEIEDDYEDDLEDDLDEPSGAFANVAQGLVGKYKNYMMQYWQNTIDSIERDEHDFKNHQLPLARIKKVMKTDEEVKMISAEAPILFAKGCDIFITELTMRAWIHAEENKRRTLQKSDIAAALQKSDMFDFLIDIVPREEERPKRKSRNLMNPVVNQPMKADPNVQMSVPMTEEQLYGQYQQQGFYQPQQQYQDSGSGGMPEDVQDPLDQGPQQNDSRYYQQQPQQQQQQQSQHYQYQ